MSEPNYQGQDSNRIALYSLARENLIKQLMREGCRRGHSAGELANRSVSAFDVAISHSIDLLFLNKKNFKDVMTIYLITGRLEELYDLCCFFTRKHPLGCGENENFVEDDQFGKDKCLTLVLRSPF